MKVRFSVSVLVLLVATGIAAGADRPPQNLHLVGDHWTAWEPPTPPAGTQVHVIVRGDTLWDLAAKFLGDPYLWPQLWERNQYILDAHWIYPGDPLAIGLEVAPVETLATGGEAAAPLAEPGTGEPGAATPEAPIAGVLSAGAAAGAPQPLGSESDIYCTGFIGELDEKFPFTIMGSEYESMSPSLAGTATRGQLHGYYGVADTVKYGLSNGDIVYLDGGRAGGMAPGSLFTAVLPERKVVHPLSGQEMGRFYRYLGRLRVLSVQTDTAIAEIVHSCDPVMVGSRLQPFEPEPVPLGRITGMRPVNLPAPVQELQRGPAILMSRDDVITLGADHVVFIDRGAEEDVTPGDVYTIYRLNPKGLPPVVLGELAVLSVHRRTALAKILQSRYSIYIGDRLEPK